MLCLSLASSHATLTIARAPFSSKAEGFPCKSYNAFNTDSRLEVLCATALQDDNIFFLLYTTIIWGATKLGHRMEQGVAFRLFNTQIFAFWRWLKRQCSQQNMRNQRKPSACEPMIFLYVSIFTGQSRLTSVLNHEDGGIYQSKITMIHIGTHCQQQVALRRQNAKHLTFASKRCRPKIRNSQIESTLTSNQNNHQTSSI